MNGKLEQADYGRILDFGSMAQADRPGGAQGAAMEGLRRFLAILPLLVILLLIVFFLFWAFCRIMRLLWRRAGPQRPFRRGLILASPILIWAAGSLWREADERRRVLARVPAPLEVAGIEHRAYDPGGLGFMPGDNPLGFAVYRLTPESAAWARAQGEGLADLLKDREGRPLRWRPTPVPPEEWGLPDDARSDPISLAGFLHRFGGSFDESRLPKAFIAEADAAILNPGALYSYSWRDGILIVAPEAGKVWFVHT